MSICAPLRRRGHDRAAHAAAARRRPTHSMGDLRAGGAAACSGFVHSQALPAAAVANLAVAANILLADAALFRCLIGSECNCVSKFPLHRQPGECHVGAANWPSSDGLILPRKAAGYAVELVIVSANPCVACCMAWPSVLRSDTWLAETRPG